MNGKQISYLKEVLMRKLFPFLARASLTATTVGLAVAFSSISVCDRAKLDSVRGGIINHRCGVTSVCGGDCQNPYAQFVTCIPTGDYADYDNCLYVPASPCGSGCEDYWGGAYTVACPS